MQPKFYIADLGGQAILIRARSIKGANGALGRALASSAKLRLASQEELLSAGRADARIIDGTKEGAAVQQEGAAVQPDAPAADAPAEATSPGLTD